MDELLDFNHVAAVAVSLQELRRDPDAPIFIEGDIIARDGDNEAIFMDMDEGEAARRVVEVVLDHPHVRELLAEQERTWEALKWIVANAEGIPFPPAAHIHIIDAAVDASGWSELDAQ